MVSKSCISMALTLLIFTLMRPFWSDPYLWVHLAGIAAVPLCLDLCLLGFSTGKPILPIWLEMLLVGAIGIVPILWMQWQRPFYIFSLPAVAVQPTQLNEDQRRILQLFRTTPTRVLALFAPIVLSLVLWKLYQLAPIAAIVSPLAAKPRVLGLLLAAIAFLAANLFMQIPVSVTRVLLTPTKAFQAIDPYPPERILPDFTILGIRVQQLLPPFQAKPADVPDVAAPEAPASEPAVPPETAAPPVVEPVLTADSSLEDPLDSPEAVEIARSSSEFVEQTANISESAAADGIDSESADLESTDFEAIDSDVETDPVPSEPELETEPEPEIQMTIETVKVLEPEPLEEDHPTEGSVDLEKPDLIEMRAEIEIQEIQSSRFMPESSYELSEPGLDDETDKPDK